MIATTKLTYWDLPNTQAGLSIVRVIYASLLELFIRDNTEEVFYYIFSDYVKEIFKGTDNVLYIDGAWNNIFHYDAIHGESRIEPYKKISKLYSEDLKKDIGIDTDVFDTCITEYKNVNNISVMDVILLNK